MDGKSRGRFRDLAYLVPSVGAVLLPKCPLCFLAFASFLDLLGIDAAAYSRSLLPVVFALLSIPIVLLGFYRTGFCEFGQSFSWLSAGVSTFSDEWSNGRSRSRRLPGACIAWELSGNLAKKPAAASTRERLCILPRRRDHKTYGD